MVPVLVTVRNPATPRLTTVVAVAPRDVARLRQVYEPSWPTSVLPADALGPDVLADAARGLARSADLGYDLAVVTVGTHDGESWVVWLADVPEPPVPT